MKRIIWRFPPRGGIIILMTGRFAYKVLPKYPHLGADEAGIWNAFIAKHPDFFDSVDYDVHVGSPRKFPGQPRDRITLGMEEMSRHRIDFVGYKDETIYIGEIKRNSQLGAIGQLLGERELYQEEFAPKTKPKLILLTDKENPDVRKLANKFGIDFYAVMVK